VFANVGVFVRTSGGSDPAGLCLGERYPSAIALRREAKKKKKVNFVLSENVGARE